MAASSVTMAAVTSINGFKVPESPSVGTSRLPTPVSILPRTHAQTMGYKSGFLGNSWKVVNSPRTTFAQHSASKRMATLPVRASVGTDNEVVEPVTGIKFSKSETTPGGTKGLVLAGVGVREKKIAFLKVKVYAVGLYVEPSIVSSLEEWKTKGASDLEKDEGFSKALINTPVEKCLRIVLARDIDGAQFWGALDEALAPRLKAVGAGAAGGTALSAFGAVFRDRPLKERTVIYLTWTQPETLKISITPEGVAPSAPDASIDSAALLSCLFDVYLGNDPVSPSAKVSIAKDILSVA